jgi:hypothetical protein
MFFIVTLGGIMSMFNKKLSLIILLLGLLVAMNYSGASPEVVH